MTATHRASIPFRLSVLAASVAVAVVALAASVAGIANDFAYDDVPMIVLNERLPDPANWPELLASPYWPPPLHQEHYRPLTSLSFAIQYVVGAGGPMAFRIVSYLLYAGTAVAVFALGRRFLPGAVALGAALLFAAHPVHVEAVAPAVGQSELLVALFAILMSIIYLDRRRADGVRPRDWAALGLLYVAASLSKESGMTVPVFLLLVEALLVKGRGALRTRVRDLWRGYLALGALAIAVVALRMAVLGGELTRNWPAEVFDGLGVGGRALTMLMVVPQWARLLLWPAHLRLDYAPQEFVASSRFGGAEAFGVALVLAGLAAIWFSRHRAPGVAFGLAWTAAALLPVSNVLMPTGVLLGERLLFLPSVGFVLALGGGFDAWWRARSDALAPAPARHVWQAAVIACGVLVIVGIARSVERQRVWRNEAYLSLRGVQDAPRSYRMQRAYAEVLFESGRREMALETYDRAIALAPRNHVWRVRNDLARRLRALGETELEAEQLRRSLMEQPQQEDTRGYLIVAYLALGRYAEAMAEADSALALGAAPQAFGGLRELADSAARAGAPPGTVRARILARPIR